MKLLFFTSKPSCLGSTALQCQIIGNLWIIRHQIRGILLYIHQSACLVVTVEPFLSVVRNRYNNWMWYNSGTLRSIAERPHTSPIPFCTTNFHIPHPLPAVSFYGFDGSFLYQKPVSSILICWHEFVLTILHQNCKMHLKRESKIVVQQYKVLRILRNIHVALNKQTGAAWSLWWWWWWWWPPWQ